MKQLIMIMMSLALLGAYSCDKNKNTDVMPPPTEPEWGADSASIIINGSITWTANGSRNGSLNDTIIEMTLDMNRQISNGQTYPFEIFSFKMIRKNMLVQKLDSFGNVPSRDFTCPEAKFFTKVNHDAINEIFKVNRIDSANNWIQITEQRNNYKEIKGKFSVTLIKSDSGSDILYPDTIRIRNGYFRVTIKD